MGSGLSKTDFNVLTSQSGWAWPVALHELFMSRGVNLLVANDSAEFVNVMGQKRIHATIIDTDHNESNALRTVKFTKMFQPFVPCVLLSEAENKDILERALELKVFCVIDKPVDLKVLQSQLNRLFVKKYNSDIFA